MLRYYQFTYFLFVVDVVPGLGGTKAICRALEMELGPESEDMDLNLSGDYEAVGNLNLGLPDIPMDPFAGPAKVDPDILRKSVQQLDGLLSTRHIAEKINQELGPGDDNEDADGAPGMYLGSQLQGPACAVGGILTVLLENIVMCSR